MYSNTRMGWLRLVGSFKLQVSFAKEPYKREYILQKRPIVLRSLLIVAIPYDIWLVNSHIWILYCATKLGSCVLENNLLRWRSRIRIYNSHMHTYVSIVSQQQTIVQIRVPKQFVRTCALGKKKKQLISICTCFFVVANGYADTMPMCFVFSRATFVIMYRYVMEICTYFYVMDIYTYRYTNTYWVCIHTSTQLLVCKMICIYTYNVFGKEYTARTMYLICIYTSTCKYIVRVIHIKYIVRVYDMCINIKYIVRVNVYTRTMYSYIHVQCIWYVYTFRMYSLPMHLVSLIHVCGMIFSYVWHDHIEYEMIHSSHSYVYF